MAYSEAPPLLCLSIGPGRLWWYTIPAHWYGGRETRAGRKRSTPTLTGPRLDPARAASRSRSACLDCAAWLFLTSRPRYVDLPRGKVVPFRMGLWTLTIPGPMPERLARRALSRWWTWARNVAGVRSYVWVAELTKRGRVHFHALVTEWIDQTAAARAWLRCLRAQGYAVGYSKPPAKMVWVENADNAGKVRGYVAKYIGKDFGTRADQLAHRYALAGTDKGAPLNARPEIRAALFDALARPSLVRRRWGASQELERKPLQVVGVDDPGLYRAITSEVRAIPGVRWTDKTDNGQGAYFDLSALTVETAPRLLRLLHDEAREIRARAHNARARDERAPTRDRHRTGSRGSPVGEMGGGCPF